MKRQDIEQNGVIIKEFIHLNGLNRIMSGISIGGSDLNKMTIKCGIKFSLMPISMIASTILSGVQPLRVYTYNNNLFCGSAGVSANANVYYDIEANITDTIRNIRVNNYYQSSTQEQISIKNYTIEISMFNYGNYQIGNISNNRGVYGDCYYYQILRNDILVRDFLPAEWDVYDGLYDRITGQFYKLETLQPA